MSLVGSVFPEEKKQKCHRTDTFTEIRANRWSLFTVSLCPLHPGLGRVGGRNHLILMQEVGPETLVVCVMCGSWEGDHC